MKVLVIGGGGREHAIAWRLAQEGAKVYASPGNPGIATIGTCIHPRQSDPEGYLHTATNVRAGLVVIGPEAPLVAGLADHCAGHGIPVIGPSAAAARLEGSKAFSKEVMAAAGVPTARHITTTSAAEAHDALAGFSYPLVLKADGLAAGKGVIIAQDRGEAEAALRSLRSTLGPTILVEEFLDGEEASFIVLSDGDRALPLEASQDHKRIFDNDLGPNTGGMGSYSDGRILTSPEQGVVMDTVIHPVLAEMKRRGSPFRGFLYAGLMMTAEGPKVLEFNVRLGDPEAQSLLHRLSGGFLDALTAAAHGTLGAAALTWRSEPSVCVVLASAGYPDTPRTGDPIAGLDAAEATGATVFHSGTRLGNGAVETAGGRVLGVTARGTGLPSAIGNAYAAVRAIHFDGMQYRTDIGRKGLKRW